MLSDNTYLLPRSSGKSLKEREISKGKLPEDKRPSLTRRPPLHHNFMDSPRFIRMALSSHPTILAENKKLIQQQNNV